METGSELNMVVLKNMLSRVTDRMNTREYQFFFRKMRAEAENLRIKVNDDALLENMNLLQLVEYIILTRRRIEHERNLNIMHFLSELLEEIIFGFQNDDLDRVTNESFNETSPKIQLSKGWI
jgi:hypothetical protein